MIKSLRGICVMGSISEALRGPLRAAGRPAQRGHSLWRRMDSAGCKSLPQHQRGWAVSEAALSG